MTHVCKLKNELYGLKQDPRDWYGIIDSLLTRFGFTKIKVDPNLYMKIMDDEIVILLVYVDDLFLIGNEKHITNCKKKLSKEFDMKDIGLMHYFLGLDLFSVKELSFPLYRSMGDLLSTYR